VENLKLKRRWKSELGKSKGFRSCLILAADRDSASSSQSKSECFCSCSCLGFVFCREREKGGQVCVHECCACVFAEREVINFLF
jgi:hypothetical protein